MADSATIADRRFRPGSARLRQTIPPLLYGLRVATAVNIALLVAFYLELENPSWAGTSAAIVCQPILGSSLRKGLFRMVGTVVGAAAAVVLTAVFPQDRVGFLFGMALWAAACSFVSTLLSNFAAYAAMLAGYTLAIIAGSSISAPDQVFLLAVARASEIGVGIACATLVMALTDLGRSPQRLADLLSGLVDEAAAHLVAVLQGAGASAADGSAVRRKLIKRAAALDPVIDQAAGEAPELRQRRSVLYAAMDGIFGALSAARTLEAHLRDVPRPEAQRVARAISEQLPPDRRAPAGSDLSWLAPRSGAGPALSLARRLIRLPATDVSLRLGADAVAQAALGLSQANNGLALLRDPAHARDPARTPRFVVPDYLPALANGFRVFVAIAAMILFWIVTAWSNGLTAVTFVAVTVLLLSPQQERSGGAALGFGIGTAIAAALAAIVNFAVLPNREGFPSFALVIAAALVPLSALSTVPALAPVLTAAAMNFVPLLGPTNEISFDTLAYSNSALGIVAGCAAGALLLVLVPPVPPAIRARRLLDLTLRDLRALAVSRRVPTLQAWQSRIYARLVAMPESAEPVQRAHLVAALSVGTQVIRLRRLSRRGLIGGEIAEGFAALARGGVPAFLAHLAVLDAAIASEPDEKPGARGRLRARTALLALAEAVRRHAAYFEACGP